MLHGDYVAQFLQGVNVSDLIHELHTLKNDTQKYSKKKFFFLSDLLFSPKQTASYTFLLLAIEDERVMMFVQGCQSIS